MDRDAIFSERFRHLLALGGCTAVRTPPSSPNCNAFVERFFRSLKEECLERLIPLSTEGLRFAIGEYIEHYHAERPHQGLSGRLIEGPEEAATEGRMVRRDRLGGILRHYCREAAG